MENLVVFCHQRRSEPRSIVRVALAEHGNASGRPARFKSLYSGRKVCPFTVPLTAQLGTRLEFVDTDPNGRQLPTLIAHEVTTKISWPASEGDWLVGRFRTSARPLAQSNVAP